MDEQTLDVALGAALRFYQLLAYGVLAVPLVYLWSEFRRGGDRRG